MEGKNCLGTSKDAGRSLGGIKCPQRFEAPSLFLSLSLVLRMNTNVCEHVYVRDDENRVHVACCAFER